MNLVEFTVTYSLSQIGILNWVLQSGIGLRIEETNAVKKHPFTMATLFDEVPCDNRRLKNWS